MTRKACVFRRNSITLGFSLALPLCLCWPKNFSKGSWHRWLLKKRETSGREKRYRVSSTKELTADKGELTIKCKEIKLNRPPHQTHHLGWSIQIHTAYFVTYITYLQSPPSLILAPFIGMEYAKNVATKLTYPSPYQPQKSCHNECMTRKQENN